MKKILFVFSMFFVFLLFSLVTQKQILNEINYNKIVFENSDFNIKPEANIEGIVEGLKKENNFSIVVQLEGDFEGDPRQPIDKDYTIEEVQKMLSDHRAKVKQYFSNYNKKILKSINLNSYEAEVNISNYSPFIFFNFENKVNEYELYEILKLSSRNEVQQIYVKRQTNNVKPELYDAIEIVNGERVIYNEIYTGDAIIIGILDDGIVDKKKMSIDKHRLVIRKELFYHETVSEHATAVASIAATNYGIARKSFILSVELSGDPSGEVDWLIDHKVNIINLSYDDTSTPGEYTSTAAFFDSIVRNNYVTIVGSAGNRGEIDGYITSPKTGHNIITVGSVNKHGQLSSFSSYKEDFAVSKPTLVAPGEDILVANLKKRFFGTSYAAPIVAGTVALLMYKKPTLMKYPELILPVLSASAVTLPVEEDRVDYSGYNDKTGAGILDIDKALEVVNYCAGFTVSNNSVSDKFLYGTTVDLVAGQTIKIAFMSLVNSEGSTDIFDKVTDYDLFLFDPNGNQLKRTSSVYNNTEMIEYRVNQTGTYTIKVKIVSPKKTTTKDCCGLVYSVR